MRPDAGLSNGRDASRLRTAPTTLVPVERNSSRMFSRSLVSVRRPSTTISTPSAAVAAPAASAVTPIGDVSMRRRIGFLPENPYFYDYLTAEELLSYYAGLSSIDGPARLKRVSQALDEVGIGAERRMRLRSFSKGMIQRVGVAQALVAEPDVVFFDEPMSGLDPLGRRDLRQLMLRLRDRGCTVFFSSHILADAEALCSRVAIVAQGRLVGEGRLSDLMAFERRGWELVISNVSDAVKERLQSQAVTVTALSDNRYTIELPAATAPEATLTDLALHGVQIVSLNPIRDTLEDFFVRRVAEVGEGARAPRKAGADAGD